jgi:hypothetical protein
MFTNNAKGNATKMMCCWTLIPEAAANKMLIGYGKKETAGQDGDMRNPIRLGPKPRTTAKGRGCAKLKMPRIQSVGGHAYVSYEEIYRTINRGYF